MPCTAFAYMSVMTYFDTTSAALRVEEPGQPGARARKEKEEGPMRGMEFELDHVLILPPPSTTPGMF